ncbi:MAG: hypothetical protein ACRDD7_01435 [Peptostreptococcaceae bacterium]
MIQLGQIMYDDKKGQINLELASFVEDNFTPEQDKQINALWKVFAENIELALQKYANKELNNGKN